MNQAKIYDVAGAAGVSLATVSRVLNHPEKVKPATREKIQRIIRELGYKPNLNAKGLASSKSTTVAVVVPELARSSIAEIVNGIAACAKRRGYLIRLFVAGRTSDLPTDEAVKMERELWSDVLASSVDGVLYIDDEMDDESERLVASFPLPIVLTNTNSSNAKIPMVSLDYKQAAYDITKEMINRGNKDIWFITSIHKYVMNELKEIGYREAMKEANLEPHVYEVSGRTEKNEQSYLQLLKEHHPEVAIVVRDSMAVSFINVARLLHIHIPNELQVIGFQNTRYAELSRPKLTCINTPIYAIGEKAMDLLTNLMEQEYQALDNYNYNKPEEKEEKVVEKILVPYDIVWRDSTK